MRRRGSGSAAGAAARRFFLVEQKELLFLHAPWSFFSLFGSLFLFSKIHKNTQAQGGSKIGRQELLFCAPFQLPACDTALHVHVPATTDRSTAAAHAFCAHARRSRDGRDPGSRVSETHKSLSHLPYRSMISIVSQHLELTVNRPVVLHWLAISYAISWARGTARRQHRMSGAVLFRHVVPSCSTRHLKKKDHSMLNVA